MFQNHHFQVTTLVFWDRLVSAVDDLPTATKHLLPHFHKSYNAAIGEQAKTLRIKRTTCRHLLNTAHEPGDITQPVHGSNARKNFSGKSHFESLETHSMTMPMTKKAIETSKTQCFDICQLIAFVFRTASLHISSK